MKDVEFVNRCAWEIESLKSKRAEVLRECNEKLEEIDKRIWSLQEQIKKKNATNDKWLKGNFTALTGNTQRR